MWLGFIIRKESKMFKRKKAFTLYELLISMGLLVLISGMIFTFIASVSKLSKKNDAVNKLVSSQVNLRAEVDFWFSVFDQYDYEISFNEQDNDDLVIAKKEQEVYKIKTYYEMNNSSTLMIEFQYPQSSYYEPIVTIPLFGIANVCVDHFDRIDTNEFANLQWYFMIPMKVKNQLYLCSVYYVE